MAQSDKLINTTTRHAVHIEGLKAGEVKRFENYLKAIDKDIRARLAVGELTAFSRGRLEQLLAAVDKSLAKIFAGFEKEILGQLELFGDYEAEFEAKSIGNSIATIETVVPAAAQVRAAIYSQPLSVRGADGGKLLAPFVKDWTATERTRIIGAIRQGFFEGQPNATIVRSIRGTKANNYADGILSTTSRNAGAIVRTAVQHVASAARFETLSANSNVVTGYRWLSTLDSRTSSQCRSLDGMVFKIGKGPRPPIHIQCRSTVVAELDGRFDFLKEGQTRASKDGQVADLDYYDWLKTQSKGFQNDVLGPIRGKLFRNGGLSAEKFARMNLSRNFMPLTLKEMKKKEPLAFDLAGL